MEMAHVVLCRDELEVEFRVLFVGISLSCLLACRD